MRAPWSATRIRSRSISAAQVRSQIRCDAIRSVRLILATIVQTIAAARSEYEAKTARRKTDENQGDKGETTEAPAQDVAAAAAPETAAASV